jgi:toxin ParE1/3/4
MAQRIVWSKRAVQDLDTLTAYIAADSPAYAGVVLKNIVNQTRVLARFPRAGRKVPEFDDENMRELVVYSYRIIYRLQDDEALIVAVIHGKRILQ